MIKKITTGLISYKTLYILCFVALNLIEFLKASQKGDVWYVAVNCTGLVMMVILFSAYPVRQFIDRINLAYTVVCLGVMAGIYIHWQSHIGHYNVWQRETAVMNVWWLGILLRHLFRQIFVEKTIRLKIGATGWVWIAMSFFMIASVSGKIWPLWFFLMFGAFYVTRYTGEQRMALLEGMADGTIISFFGIQIYAYGFRPYDTVRYVGAYGNCNAMALFYLVVYCMVLYKLHLLQMRKANKWLKLYYLVGAGGLLCFQMFTLCRTAWLVSALITFIYGIFVVRRMWKLNVRGVCMRAVALALAVCFTFLPVYETIRWLPTILHYRIWYDGEYDVQKVHSFDPPNSYKYVSLEEFLEAAGGRVLSMLLTGGQKTKDLQENKPEETPAQIISDDQTGIQSDGQAVSETGEAKELEAQRPGPGDENYVELIKVSFTDDLSSLIRLTIYKAYLKDMKWFGNGPDKGYYWIGDTGYMSRHAQNLWIQMGYSFGIFAGILSIVLTVLVMLRHTKALVTKKGAPYGIIPFFVCVIFFSFGITEIVWNLGQIIMFLMFFVQHPAFLEEYDEKE